MESTLDFFLQAHKLKEQQDQDISPFCYIEFPTTIQKVEEHPDS